MKISAVVSLYLSHKRALGCVYKTEEAIFRSFCKIIGDKSVDTINAKAVMSFINGNGLITAFSVKKYRVLSGLYRFVLTRDLAKVTPLPNTIPKPTAPPFVPYIYSHEEIKRLLDAIPATCTNRVPIDEEVIRILILLLYSTGLRLGEALSLTINDVHLEHTYLHVIDTKFFKSRLVPFGKDLTRLLTTYISEYRGYYNAPSEAPLFCFRNEEPLSQSATRNAFRRMRLHAVVQRKDGSRYQPRLQDFRHTAAVHRLIEWYRSGADLQILLPKLATYLGHVDLSSTQRYLSMTPELLQEASLRFEQYAIGEPS